MYTQYINTYVYFCLKGFSEKAKQWIDRRDRELRKQEARLEDEKKKKAMADAKNALKVHTNIHTYISIHTVIPDMTDHTK